MKKSNIKLTPAQFAKLHGINKRTLHYYDNIGLFSPAEKGENGYRYYDISQSVVFEYILMLKELNMSIDEIKNYYKTPTPENFLEIAEIKENEIDREIENLRRIKNILKTRKEQLNICKNLKGEEIRVEESRQEKISILPYDFSEDNISALFSYIKDKWKIEQIRMGIGSFISLDKVKAKNFEKYDGIYTYEAEGISCGNTVIKPGGKYLCGYQKGTWDKAPIMYEKLLKYAEDNDITLTGFVYEIGLNEFAISEPEEYVTKFMVKIKE